jgi:cysteinyl-tRNA synthetase
MSKSKGNFFTVRDIVKEFDYEVIRFFMLSAHYRNPINFSRKLLEQAKSGLDRIYTCIDNLEHLDKNATKSEISDGEKEIEKSLDELKDKFIKAMDDDLNTADAIAAIFDIVKESNTNINADSSKEIIEKAYFLLKELGKVLGIGLKEREKNIDSEIQELIERRQQARKEKNWKEADEIRDKLKEMGITLQDTPQGVKVVYDK